jgi:signal transduction histidine kinase
LGFEKALEWLAEEVQKQHGVTTLFENDGKPKPLDDDVRVLLFRTVNELLINVVKHAQAQKTKVSVRRDRDNIKINVEDDGIGFDVSKTQHHVDKAGGFGLFRIRERLNYLGGQIKIESEPNRGTRVSLVVPVKCNGKNTKEQVQ